MKIKIFNSLKTQIIIILPMIYKINNVLNFYKTMLFYYQGLQEQEKQL